MNCYWFEVVSLIDSDLFHFSNDGYSVDLVWDLYLTSQGLDFCAFQLSRK